MLATKNEQPIVSVWLVWWGEDLEHIFLNESDARRAGHKIGSTDVIVGEFKVETGS